MTSLGQVWVALGWLLLFVAAAFALTVFVLFVMSLTTPRAPRDHAQRPPRGRMRRVRAPHVPTPLSRIPTSLSRIPLPARRPKKKRGPRG